MKRNYNLNHRLTATILLLSLCLQSCLNQSIPPMSLEGKHPSRQDYIKEQPLGAKSYKQEQAAQDTSIPITVRKDLLVTADELQIGQPAKSTTGSSIQPSCTSSTKRSSDNPTVKKSVQEKRTKTTISAGFNRLSPIKTQLNKKSIWKFKTRQGQLVRAYQQGEKYQADVREKIGNFTREYTLPIYLEPSMTLEKLASLPKLIQEQYIQFVLAKRAVNQQGYIYIGKGGVLGGMMEGDEEPRRGKEKKKEKEKEEKPENNFNNHENLLESAIEEGNAEAQFVLGERAYYVWLYQYRKGAYHEAKFWLSKAAAQSHQEAIILLDTIKRREVEIQSDRKLEKLLDACERLNLNKLLPLIPKQEIEIQWTLYLGSGSFGDVYQANYQGKMVAVKKLQNNRHLHSQFAAFQKECIIMANHPHNNIVTFLGFCPQENCLIMEYAAGGSLWSLLKDKTKNISWKQRCQIGLDVAEGMSYLHDREIVHGDLKSDNILLDNELHAKITDFGTSALKSENSTHGTWGGTLSWAAPETFITLENSKAVDVYSYGMVLWQLGARKKPFETFSTYYTLGDHLVKAGGREVITEDTPSYIRKVIELCWLPEPPLKEETDKEQRPEMQKVRHLLQKGYYAFLEKDKYLQLEELLEADNTYLLHRAAEKGSVEIVKILLEKGVDVNLLDIKAKASPLHYAALNSHIEVVKLLIENGADVHTKIKDDYPPLYWAAENDHLEIVKLLIEKGADLDAESKYGNSTLCLAIEKGHLAIVKLLIEKGADIHVKNKHGYTPLCLAAQNGHLEIVELLIEKGSDIHVKNGNSNTPLCLAAQKGHSKIVKLLIEKGADIHVKGFYDYTPLCLAAQSGHLEIVELLIEKGADIHVKNNKGYTPLCLAAQNGHLEIVKLLIEKEADVHVKNRNGDTPLCLAVSNGYLEIVKLLIEKEADIHVKNRNGDTPLCLAVSNGYLEIVKLLIEKGADIHVKSKNGNTPLCLAVQGRYVEIVKLLIERGADIHVKGFYDYTPLCLAVQGDHLAIVKLLIEKGADIQVKSKGGNTPLCLAVQGGHLEIVKLLIERGADIHVKVFYDYT